MADIHLTTVDQVETFRLEGFLKRVYPKPKSEFLCSHGKWWYRGDENRWVILSGDDVAAYFAIIPTKCLIKGVREPAFWWVDLIVAPEFRGRGLQTFIDRKIRERTEIKLGFPNVSVAKIHEGHGWGVRRDLQVMLLPLWPLRVKRVHFTDGLIGCMLRLGAVTMTPLVMLNRLRLTHYVPISARFLESASADLLETIFLKYKREDTIMTYRDADYFQWRYFEAPYRSELVFYVDGANSRSAHCVIARHVRFQDVMTTRILDVFGDFDDLWLVDFPRRDR